jgi:hypothetical protein
VVHWYDIGSGLSVLFVVDTGAMLRRHDCPWMAETRAIF